ncbi:MAG: hypothetical protein C4551_07755 [Bacillota bacterium]|nr:MAG: hypothetical protein C4551_07755 [Bacillota bacterium]
MSQRGVTVLRWTARISSLVLAAIVLLMMFSPDPYREPRPLRLDEIIGLAIFPWTMLAGTLLAWRRPRVGSLIAIGSVPALYIVQIILRGSFPFSAFFLVPLIPAFLFLWLSFVEPKGTTGAEPQKTTSS